MMALHFAGCIILARLHRLTPHFTGTLISLGGKPCFLGMG
jgi:hypothetical protein